tara:strand:+ start:1310 stop:2407 length:1098 start_codon:yes stop_codon:yes gene_type:complete
MNNIGDTVTGGEIILNSFQSQVFAEVVLKFKNFGIEGQKIDSESYVVQKELARFVTEAVPVDESDIRQIPRYSQIVFRTITNPELYDTDIVDDGLLQWLEIGNPNSFFSKGKTISDMSGLKNDGQLVNTKVDGFRRNGTIDNKQIPSVILTGKRSFINVSSVLDDILQDDEDGTTNGLLEGTVEMWVNLDKKGMGKQNQYHTLFNAHVTGTTFGLFAFVGRNGELRLAKGMYDIETERRAEGCYSPIRTIPFGKWTHLAIVFSEDGVICYVDGEGYKLVPEMNGMPKAYPDTIRGFMNGFEPVVDGDEIITLSPDKFFVGITRFGDKFKSSMEGKVSSFRIYESALDGDDIEKNFSETKGQYIGE